MKDLDFISVEERIQRRLKEEEDSQKMYHTIERMCTRCGMPFERGGSLCPACLALEAGPQPRDPTPLPRPQNVLEKLKEELKEEDD